jgi:hypothetical protein
VRRKVGSRGEPGRLERRGEGDRGRPLAVGAYYLGDLERALGVAEQPEQGLDALEAEGDVAPAVQLVADGGE